MADTGSPEAVRTVVFVGQVTNKGTTLTATYDLTVRDFQGNGVVTDHGTVHGSRIQDDGEQAFRLRTLSML